MLVEVELLSVRNLGSITCDIGIRLSDAVIETMEAFINNEDVAFIEALIGTRISIDLCFFAMDYHECQHSQKYLSSREIRGIVLDNPDPDWYIADCGANTEVTMIGDENTAKINIGDNVSFKGWFQAVIKPLTEL